MATDEGIVLALATARETAQSAQLAIRSECVATLGDDLVGVGLVPNVPNQLIVRRIEHVMEGGSQFDRTQARSQMSRIYGTLFDDVVAQFVAKLRKFIDAQCAKFSR